MASLRVAQQAAAPETGWRGAEERFSRREPLRTAPMLAADKLLLQSNVKQRAIQLREKELNLFNDK